jgi:hypothetical protein
MAIDEWGGLFYTQAAFSGGGKKPLSIGYEAG